MKDNPWHEYAVAERAAIRKFVDQMGASPNPPCSPWGEGYATAMRHVTELLETRRTGFDNPRLAEVRDRENARPDPLAGWPFQSLAACRKVLEDASSPRRDCPTCMDGRSVGPVRICAYHAAKAAVKAAEELETRHTAGAGGHHERP